MCGEGCLLMERMLSLLLLLWLFGLVVNNAFGEVE